MEGSREYTAVCFGSVGRSPCSREGSCGGREVLVKLTVSSVSISSFGSLR